jgi:cysteine sulfinate desulfinase/cysteine desulfurase-like protein
MRVCRAAIRIAVSRWMTTEADIDRTIAAFRAGLSRSEFSRDAVAFARRLGDS